MTTDFTSTWCQNAALVVALISGDIIWCPITHLIAFPRTENGMRKAHRPYARMINFREGKERVSVAGTVLLIRDGWKLFAGSGQVHRVKSGKGTISYWSDSISLEQCESPYWETRWCACKGVTAVRVDCWLGWIFEGRTSGEGISATPLAWTDRQTSWQWFAHW